MGFPSPGQAVAAGPSTDARGTTGILKTVPKQVGTELLYYTEDAASPPESCMKGSAPPSLLPACLKDISFSTSSVRISSRASASLEPISCWK